MERIGRPDPGSYPRGRRARTETRSKADGPRFENILDATTPVDPAPSGSELSGNSKRDRKNLEELLDEIYELGEAVKKEPGQETVLSYKRAVRRLVRIAVNRGLDVEEQLSSPNILRQKRFTLVKVIDQRLDRLVSEVLVSQRDAIDVLARIDEINGLLVDLVS